MPSDSSKDFDRFRALEPDRLLETQAPAVREILKGFAKLLKDNEEEIRQGLSDDLRPDEYASTKRPHQAFLIDGARGSGKTYTLLSAEHALHKLDEHVREVRGKVSDLWKEKLNDWIGQTRINPIRQVVLQADTLCHTLHIIFPGDMEDGDAVMEALFAAMTTRTEEVADKLKNSPEDSDRQRAEAAEELNKLLTEQVAQGWYFARRFGYDALVRDSTDYNDLVGRFEEESRKAANRIEAWRKFLEIYLKFHRAAMLVVLLDDSDVKPELTDNILHAMRMYLNHPRVVTVLAGNLKSMRNSLLHLEMKRLGPAVQALNRSNQITATDWRRHERQNIEDYLEKVLPPAQRIWLGRPRLVSLKERENAKDENKTDFYRIVGETLTEVCSGVMRYTRKRFIKVKFSLAIARELGRSDEPQLPEKWQLEDYLSWWMFANRYREQLQPLSVRQLQTWKEYYLDISRRVSEEDQYQENEDGHKARAKRLPVMLFENPANFALIHRLADGDERLIEWLRRQHLSSTWVERRTFRINDRDVDEGSYTYGYIQYRHDVGLATPVRDNADDIMTSTLMPQLVGRRFMRRFFQPRQMPRRHRRIGLAQWLDHAAVPASCCYMFDIAKLPDASFVKGSPSESGWSERVEKAQSGDWEAGLCENWMQVIEDRQERQDGEYLLRYLREIVFEALRETKGISSESLMMELDPTDAYEKHKRSIYQHFLKDEMRSFRLVEIQRRVMFREKAVGMTPEGLIERGKADKAAREAGKAPDLPPGAPVETKDIQAPERMLALYSALVTDLRRAWHAIRIYQAAPNLAEDREGRSHFPYEYSSFAAIANRDRMPILTVKKLKGEILQATGWAQSMLEIFSKKSIEQEFGKGSAVVNRLFNPKDDIITSEVVTPGLEEKEDFRKWNDELRSVGRAACDGWPIRDSTDTLKLEGKFFSEKQTQNFKLDIFELRRKDASEGAGSKDGGKERIQEKRRNGRSARNFTWLLWGLAPSLPAIIHAEVMSLAYKAELDWSAANRYADGSDKDERSVLALREWAVYSYKKAFDLTEEWTELVGTLSVTLRYIKIKCHHLDAALLFENILLPDTAGEDVVELLKRNDFEYQSKDAGDAAQRAAAIRAMRKIKDMFGTFRDGGKVKHLARNLAISPDISPTSLFGDDWIGDLLHKDIMQQVLSKEGFEIKEDKKGSRSGSDGDSRDTAVDNSDNPLETSGIFVEAQQWLWASNRSLRKLHNEISQRYDYLGNEFRKFYPNRAMPADTPPGSSS